MDENNQGGDGQNADQETFAEDTDRNSLEAFSKKWLSVQMTHEVSAAAANSFWKEAFQFIPNFIPNNESSHIPGFIHMRRKLYKGNCPQVHMKFVFLDRDSGEIKVVHTETNPGRQYNRAGYIKLYEEAHIKVSSLFHVICAVLFKNNNLIIS